MLCRHLGFFTDALVAIDGSKFKAVNNRDRNFTQAKLKRQMEEVEKSLDRYLSDLDSADRQEPDVAQARTERLQDRIEVFKARMEELKSIGAELEQAPDKQVSLTDGVIMHFCWIKQVRLPIPGILPYEKENHEYKSILVHAR